MSGIYEDDFDKADKIIYTGQGGNNWIGNRHQKTEQKMLHGNLALNVSWHYSFDSLFWMSPCYYLIIVILSYSCLFETCFN
jgi:hypothetical protein